jgi:hypothetical protein
MAQQATGLVSQEGEGARSAVERIAAFATAAGFVGQPATPVSARLFR